MASPRLRDSLQHVQYLYDSGEDRSKLENLIRAFRGIQALPPDDPDSFSLIAGFHGMPWRGPGAKDPNWWGGYCWHSTVLFPTWHRAYILRLEDALRSIKGCQDVTLPFWDELADLGSKTNPIIPSVLTSQTFELDGRTDNPLFSYKLQQAMTDAVETNRYGKPVGYETVRYPLSGLVGTEADQEETAKHNAVYANQSQNVKILNNNVTEWMLGTLKIPDDDKHTPRPDTYSVRARYYRCLLAPNYTVFSNTSSQAQWIKDHGQEPSSHYVVALESPHNAIHLSLGGFYQEGVYNADVIRGANGDMGDNESAGFDPIFFFHHCFIDYTFAVWQRLWNLEKRGSLTVIKDYPGTILQEGQPPNFGIGTHLDMTIPLYPFENSRRELYTSDDMTDLKELGISYGPGSLDPLLELGHTKSPFDILDSKLDHRIIAGSSPNAPNPFALIKWVHGINRADYEGSFIIRLYAEGYDGKEVEVGREPVLSRRNVKGCRNCQNHLEVHFHVPIDHTALQVLQGPNNAEIKWRTKIQTRDRQNPIFIPTPGQGRAMPVIEDL